MKALKLTLIMLLTLNLVVNSDSSVVPNDAENQEGNDWSVYPFHSSNMRYQQVYDASQFSAIPFGGAYITFIVLRSDCILHSGSAQYTNLQVNLSTTSKAPDQLSSVFAENVGTNDLIVFGPGVFSLGMNGGGNCPLPFVSLIVLDTPFFYNPAQGNLLMEVRLNGVMYINGTGFAHDAVNLLGDSVSRVYALSSDATVATQIDTIGLVTAFEFHTVPALTNSLATNGVVLTWPTQPTTFALQSTGNLGTSTTWQPYPTNQIGGGSLYRVVTIPYASLSTRQFFRLVWETGAPIPASKMVGNRPVIEAPTGANRVSRGRSPSLEVAVGRARLLTRP